MNPDRNSNIYRVLIRQHPFGYLNIPPKVPRAHHIHLLYSQRFNEMNLNKIAKVIKLIKRI